MPVLDTGARGSTVTFAQRELGDVLLAWENEAFLALDEFGSDKFDIVVPPQSILAEPPVAVVDGKRQGQWRREGSPRLSRVPLLGRGADARCQVPLSPIRAESGRSGAPESVPELKLVSIDDPIFGGWAKARPYHFGDGGVFDQIYRPGR